MRFPKCGRLLCTPRQPRKQRGQKQDRRGRCSRRLQPRAAESLPEKWSGIRHSLHTGVEAAPGDKSPHHQPGVYALLEDLKSVTDSGAVHVQFSISLDEDLTAAATPTELASSGAKRRRRRRGLRVFYRPVSGPGANYYTVPFPPPETLRLELGGEDELWQDLEVRVIGHQGIVVWQDLQTRSCDVAAAGTERVAAAQRCQSRKFGSAVQRPPLSSLALPLLHQPGCSREAAPQAAVLTIEATILHWPSPRERQQRGRHRSLDSVSSQSNATRGSSSSKPMHLIRHLRILQQAQHEEQTQQTKKLLRQMRMQQQQTHNQEQEQKLLAPLEAIDQQSRIPRLRTNWQQCPQLQDILEFVGDVVIQQELQQTQLRFQQTQQLQPQTQHLQPQTQQLQPQTQQLQPQTQHLQPQTQHLQPQTQQLQPQTQHLQPQAQQLQPQTQQPQPQTPKLQPQTQQLQPQTKQPQPQTPKLQPQTQQLQPQTHQLLPQTHQLLPQTQQLQPQTHQLLPQTQQLQPQTQQLQPQTRQLQPQTQQLQPQTQQSQAHPQQQKRQQIGGQQQQAKLQRQPKGATLSDQELKMLRKLQKTFQEQLQRQSRAKASTGQRMGRKRSHLPSYMRPYSPVLHYPVPSKLPVAIHYRPALRGVGNSTEGLQSHPASQGPALKQ